MLNAAHRHANKEHGISDNGVLAAVLAVCAVCWGACYVLAVGYPVAEDAAATPLWNAICRLLSGKELTYAVGMLLTLGGAYLLHRASYALVLIRERTTLPFLFYVLLVSTNPGFLPLKATSVGVFCLILAFYELLSAYHDAEARSNAFNVGLLLGAGSLLWVQILWFLPLFWIGMYMFMTLNLRTFAATLIGVATVCWLLFGWCFFTDDSAPIDFALSHILSVRSFSVPDVTVASVVGICAATALAVAATVNIFVHEYEDSRRSRHMLLFTALFAVWALAMYLLLEGGKEELLSTACAPVAVLAAHFFATVRGRGMTFLLWATVALFTAVFFFHLWSFS